jgi:hypothetical protein
LIGATAGAVPDAEAAVGAGIGRRIVRDVSVGLVVTGRTGATGDATGLTVSAVVTVGRPGRPPWSAEASSAGRGTGFKSARSIFMSGLTATFTLVAKVYPYRSGDVASPLSRGA